MSQMTDTAAAKQHTIRWKMVRAMCETYKSEQDLHVVYTQRKPSESTSSFQGQVEALCAKEMCTPLDRVEFFIHATMTLEACIDMAFGSINKTSDLDMSIRLASVDVWQRFVTVFEKIRNKHVRGSASFVLDMQLLVDPYMSMHPLHRPIDAPGEFLCPQNDLAALLSLVVAMAVHYRSRSAFKLGAWAEKHEWGKGSTTVSFPNAASIRSRVQENDLFSGTTHMLSQFFANPTFRNLTLVNATKPEGLVTIGSLAASGVYDIKELAPSLKSCTGAIVAAMFELLLNALVHKKRKYATRLITTLLTAKGRVCTSMTDFVRLVTTALPLQMSSAPDYQLMRSILAHTIGDMANGGACDKVISANVWVLRTAIKRLLDEWTGESATLMRELEPILQEWESKGNAAGGGHPV